MKKMIETLKKINKDVMIIDKDKKNFDKKLDEACQRGALIVFKKGKYFYINEINDEEYYVNDKITFEEMDAYFKKIEKEIR